MEDLKWNGVNWPVIDFLNDVLDKVSKSMMELPTDADRIFTLRKIRELISTIKKRNLTYKTDYEATAILIWRKSLGSLTADNQNADISLLPYTDAMYEVMLDEAPPQFVEPNFSRYRIPPDRAQRYPDAESQSLYIELQMLAEQPTRFNEYSVFDYLDFLLRSMVSENIKKNDR